MEDCAEEEDSWSLVKEARSLLLPEELRLRLPLPLPLPLPWLLPLL